jgi:hypothetical protein
MTGNKKRKNRKYPKAFAHTDRFQYDNSGNTILIDRTGRYHSNKNLYA